MESRIESFNLAAISVVKGHEAHDARTSHDQKGYNHAMAALILVVEDETELARVLRDYLERAGYRVEMAYDGTSAISVYQHSRPDLVLLDLNLHGMDGLDVARAMRRERNVPIIMVTCWMAGISVSGWEGICRENLSSRKSCGRRTSRLI